MSMVVIAQPLGFRNYQSFSRGYAKWVIANVDLSIALTGKGFNLRFGHVWNPEASTFPFCMKFYRHAFNPQYLLDKRC